MVNPGGCVPYAADSRWYAAWLQDRLPESDRRHLNRCTLRGNNGPLQLTVPLIGGGKVLKSRHITEPEISDHGSWPRLHYGALEANYGREPYFQHFAPALERIYSSPPQLLCEFNGLIHDLIVEWLGGARIQEIRAEASRRRDLFLRVARELSPHIDPQLSVLDPLMRIGPEAIFPLMLAL